MVATYFTRGLGCKFQRSADTGSTYVDTMAVVDMKPAGRARATIDVSNLTDEDDEFAAANRTPGTVELTVRYKDNEATVKAVHDDMDTATPGYYRIYYSSGYVQPIRGLITNWDIQTISRTGDVQAKITIQATGAVPYPAAAG